VAYGSSHDLTGRASGHAAIRGSAVVVNGGTPGGNRRGGRRRGYCGASKDWPGCTQWYDGGNDDLSPDAHDFSM